MIAKILRSAPFVVIALTVCLQGIAYGKGFPNQNQANAGELLAGPVAPHMGRLAVIGYLGGYVITIPEKPGSDSSDDKIMRAWDISNPSNPIQVGTFGETEHPFLAHGLMTRDNELYVGGYPNNAIRVNSSGQLERVPWSGPDGSYSKSGMARPWAGKDWWSYNSLGGNAWIELDGVKTAEWDHLGQTGVIGFANFMGNILIYASEQSNTGVAAYDVSNPNNPVLLDVYNKPASEGGIGGYWNEIYGHYIVFARRDHKDHFAGVQVVDFSDPSNLKMHCEIDVHDPAVWGGDGTGFKANPMYLAFQDEYLFTERFKINIETCQLELAVEEVPNNVDTSQYARPLGNLLVTGGYPSFNMESPDGMAIWVHQEAPDNRAPFIAHHIPEANQTNYPVMAPISIMIPETLQSETVVVTETAGAGETETLIVQEVGGGKVAIDYVISHTGMITVDPIEYLKPNTTYEVVLTSGIKDAAGNGMENYSFRFSTGSGIDGSSTPNPPTPDPVDPPVINDVNVSIDGPVVVFENMSIEVSATGGSLLSYQFELNGNEPWISSNSQTFNFSQPGTYTINVRARDASGNVSELEVVTVQVVESLVEYAPGPNGSQLFCSELDRAVWGVNPDNDSVFKYDANDNSIIFERRGVDKPRQVAETPAGHAWVTSSDNDEIVIYNASGSIVDRINTGYGSAPYGIVISPDGTEAYVTLYGSGELARFDVASRAEIGNRINLGPTPKAIALSADGNSLLVTRFISGENWGEVWQVNVTTWAREQTYRLEKHLEEDDIDEGRGVPNYLADVIINEAGTRAYIVGTKHNVDRGPLNGAGLDLDDDNSVRTIMMILDLETRSERRNWRVDIDNADSPSALGFSGRGDVLYVALQGINQVFVFDVNASTGRLGDIRSQIKVGHAPQGMCLDRTHFLFVKNFTDRTISAIDLQDSYLNPPIAARSTVASEKLSAAELNGLRIFYDAANGLDANGVGGKMSAEGYISCATCHVDGGSDGRTYDFTGRGEGIRNTISLKGRSGTRFGDVHWSANFDEIQDFEHDIRNAFQGRGLMTDSQFASANTTLGTPKAGKSKDLDDLAAYVSSLGKESLAGSPHRRFNGTLTSAGGRGRTLFTELGCNSCHMDQAFTDGETHNVGTLRSYSGGRLNGELTAIKTPSLLGLFETAPYMHDGSAQAVEDVFKTVGGTVIQAEEATTSGTAEYISHLGRTFSYLRDGEAVRLHSGGALELSNVDGQSGGGGFIRIRYGSNSQDTTLDILVNGTTYSLPVLAQPTVEGVDAAFIESKAVAVELQPGTTNIVEVVNTSNDSIVVDDITVSTSDNIEEASVHTVAASLSADEMDDLVSYLLQIDRQDAPSDNEILPFGTPVPTSGGNEQSSGGGQQSSSGGSQQSSSGGGGGGSIDWVLLLSLMGGLTYRYGRRRKI